MGDAKQGAYGTARRYCTGVVVLVLVVAWGLAATGARAGEAADQQRLVNQLGRDLESVDRAIESTRDLIQRSMHRPYLPDLYLRLAELYIEKSRILYHLKRVKNPNESKAVVVLEANLLKTKAIDLYSRIRDEFPEYAYGDKVLFFMAHEYRELGQYKQMMKCYNELVERFPDSPYRLETYLLIGDYYFDSMNLEKAEEAYQKILAAPESYVHGMARYKMAWCHINRSKYPEAFALLEKIAADPRYEKQKTEIDAYKRVNLRREALMDLAYCYTEVKPADEALAYFADLADSKSVYLAVLDKLAQRYFLKEDWAAAADVYRTIISLSQNPEKNTGYAEKLFACAQKAEGMKHPEKNVQMLIRALEQVEFSWRIDKDEKERLRKEFEIYARDMATRLHLQAKESRDKLKYGQAADAYAYYLECFRKGPQAHDILENQAEALYDAGRYFQAALTYEKLVASQEAGPEDEAPGKDGGPEEGEQKRVAGQTDTRPEMSSGRGNVQGYLYGAVASFYRALKEQEGLDDLQKLEARQGLRQVGTRYLAAYPNAEDAPEVAFNVAWVSYEQGDYAAALEGFKAFIEKYPGSKEALAAGHLVLDMQKSLDNLDGLIADARALLANERLKDPTFRKEVEDILVAAEHRRVEELTVKVKDGVEGSDMALLALASQAKDTELQEVALYNLFVVNKEAGNIPKVMEVGRQVLAKTSDAKRREDVLATMAHFCFEVADFPRAATYSEQAAQEGDGDRKAEHLLRAARLQAWMGNPVAAVKDYRAALVLLPPAKQLEAKKGLVEAYRALKSWAEVAALCRELMEREPDALRWVFWYGEAKASQGRNAEAMEAFRKVEQGFARKISSAPEAVRPEERAYAAQARYLRADKEVRAFRAIRIRGEKIDSTLIQKKLQALQAVEAAGLEVAQYGSPRWTIASLVMAAGANEEIAGFFLEAPEPKGLNMAQRQQYRRLVEDKVRPYRDKAAQYRKAALEKAHALGVFCPEVRACYAALNGGSMPPGIQRTLVGQGETGQPGPGPATPEAVLASLYADPRNPALLKALAGAYSRQGQAELASLVVLRCLELDPKDAEAQNLLGLIRLAQGRDQEAFGFFQRALELDPGLDAARANLVVLNEGYGNLEKAKELLSQIQDKGPLLTSHAGGVNPGFPAAVGRLDIVALKQGTGTGEEGP